MKRKRYIQAGGLLMIAAVLLLGLADVSGITHGAAPQATTTKPINVTIYLTTKTLGQIFENRINQMLRSAVSDSVSKLPAQNREWALKVATTLLEPNASVTSLVPQPEALSVTVRVSLYTGDPQPLNARMQISFTVVSPSVVQVSVKPLAGSPSFANGSGTTIQVPLGQLRAIHTMSTCGDTALAMNLQFPLSLGQVSSVSGETLPSSGHRQESPVGISLGLPAPSLATIGDSVGTMPINGAMSAKNVRIQAQNGMLNITSDLYLGSLNIGSSKTAVETTASGGNLAVHVVHTSVQLLHILPFPYDIYNQQLESTLNAKLQSAFMNKMYVTQSAIGTSAQVPCAPSDGLLVTGTAYVG